MFVSSLVWLICLAAFIDASYQKKFPQVKTSLRAMHRRAGGDFSLASLVFFLHKGRSSLQLFP